jgi:hypothetical protein
MDREVGAMLRKNYLLLADALINLLLGLALLVFPAGLAAYMGVPVPEFLFYPNLLGAVLFGIGIALLFESGRRPDGPVGLGLGGAIAINICGSLVLTYWLVSGRLATTVPGALLLWAVVIVVFGLAVFETLYFRRNGLSSS